MHSVYREHKESKRLVAKGIGRKMDQKSSATSRWLNRKINFTFKSIAKLEAELGEILIEIATSSIQEKEMEDREIVFKVSKRKTKKPEDFNDVVGFYNI